MHDIAQIANNYLLYFLVPAWIVPGLADYFCHRRSRIEATSGLLEAVLHCLLMGVIGIPIFLCLLFEINALVIMLAIAAYIVHQGLVLWDVSYAVTKRIVTPIEQHVHGFLEALPFTAMSFIICLYWGQAQALIGLGTETADFGLHWKTKPLAASYLVTAGSVVFLFLAVPYGEEVWRCYRAARRTGSPDERSASKTSRRG